VKGTLHWVCADEAVTLPVRLYDRLFLPERPDQAEGPLEAHLNPDSLVERQAAGEPALAALAPGDHVQLERQGYFFADPEESRPGAPVLNRTVTLKDTWARRRAGAGEARAEAAAPRTKPAAAPAPRRVSEAAQALAEADGLDPSVAEALCAVPSRLALYRAAVRAGAERAEAAKWIANVLAPHLKDASPPPFDGAALAELCAATAGGQITTQAAKEVLEAMLEGAGRPAEIIEARGLSRLAGEDALRPLVEAVLAEHPEEVRRYRQGKRGLLGFFLGQVMKKSGGAADPEGVRRLLTEALDGEG
jgi:glutaminyl-tRNA synthetase